jgi:hypothetical protein
MRSCTGITRQNPLTSEKVLREYSESLDPLKLFYLKTQTSFTASILHM